nr:SRPBCC family protein [Micromonospora sp. DSM 115978]
GLGDEGQEVTWRARHFGVPITMTSRITALEFPVMFIDEQVKGPFASFRHVHEFQAVPGGTVMTDRVEFKAPFGPLGRVVERLVLGRFFERLIVNRRECLPGR